MVNEWTKDGVKFYRKRPTIGGKEVQWTAVASNFSSKAQAERAFEKWKAEKMAEAIVAAKTLPPVAVDGVSPVEYGEAVAQSPTPQKVSTLAVQWLADLHKRTEISKEVSPEDRLAINSYSSYKLSIRHFTTLYGDHGLSVEKISDAVTKYRTDILSQISRSKIAKNTACGRIATVGAMFRWGYKKHKVKELPRDSDDLFSDFVLSAIEKQDIKTTIKWPELKKLMDSATQNMRCYMLLGLNCGIAPIDIGILKKDAIRDGYLYGERQKTGEPFKFKLWSETLGAINNASKSDRKDFPFLLCSKRGETLNFMCATEKGADKDKEKSRVVEAFAWNREKTDVPKNITYYTIRRLGSTLASAYGGMEVREMYLAHSIKGMGANYEDRFHPELQKKLDAATDKIRSDAKLNGIFDKKKPA